jgi:uncharacterized membrane protein
MDKKTFLIYMNIAILVIAWVMAFSSYSGLPDRIPTHFNFRGVPDAWGEKTPFVFFMLPAVQTILVLLMLILLRYPQLYNFPQKIEVRRWPDKFKQPVYDYLKMFMIVIASLINVLFLIILNMVITSAQSGEISPFRLYLMIGFVVIWLPLTVVFLIKISRIVAKQRKKMAAERH